MNPYNYYPSQEEIDDFIFAYDMSSNYYEFYKDEELEYNLYFAD